MCDPNCAFDPADIDCMNACQNIADQCASDACSASDSARSSSAAPTWCSGAGIPRVEPTAKTSAPASITISFGPLRRVGLRGGFTFLAFHMAPIGGLFLLRPPGWFARGVHVPGVSHGPHGGPFPFAAAGLVCAGSKRRSAWRSTKRKPRRLLRAGLARGRGVPISSGSCGTRAGSCLGRHRPRSYCRESCA
jgi:hypothetical protein